MSYQILILSIGVFSLLLGQIILILLSIKWLNTIRLTCSDINVTNKQFSSIHIKAQNEVAGLYQKIAELSAITVQKERHMLHTTFHLEDIDVNLKILLQEFRTFAIASNIQSQSNRQ